ncbi:MAG: cytochrome B6-F complex subunit VI (PetL) [Leptolyngbyaceae bacterium]|nr:cytochrome B6-F complex subunit VI (PetL) [Leptolyngbyaceae bacterium]
MPVSGAIAYTVMLFGFLGAAITLFWGLRAFKII